MEGFTDEAILTGAYGWTERENGGGSTTIGSGRDGSGSFYMRSGAVLNNLGARVWRRGISAEASGATRLLFQYAIRPSGTDALFQAVTPSSNSTLFGHFCVIGPSNVDGATTDSIAFAINSGKLSLVQGQGTEAQWGTPLASSTQTNLFTANVWSFVEVNVKPGLTGTGLVSVRVNGQLAFNEVAVSVAFDSIGIGQGVNRGSNGIEAFNEIDDFVISASDQATVEWLGDRSVRRIAAADVGSETDGTNINGGPPTAQAVQPSTTEFNTLENVGDRQTFTFDTTSIPANVSIAAVQERMELRNPLSGTNASKGLLKLGANESLTSTVSISGTPSYNSYVAQATKPGGGAWTRSDLDTLEAGVEIA